jgi:hypothetical protein
LKDNYFGIRLQKIAQKDIIGIFSQLTLKKKISQIKQKLYDNLGFIIEEKKIDDGRVGDSDLFYELFCIEATKSEVNFSEIYLGRVRKNRNLQLRKSQDGWNGLINKLANDEFS